MLKTLTKSGGYLLKWLPAVALAVSAQVSAAPLAGPVGPGPGFGVISSAAFGPTNFGPGWQFGDDPFIDRVGVTGDQSSGQWLKNLENAPAILNQPYFLLEYLVIDGDSHWKYWIEEILTPGWIVVESIMFSSNPNVPFVVPGGIGTPSLVFDFAFNPLYAGETIEIFKLIACVVPGECGGGETTVQIAQYPVVPEPGTLLLLAGGLAGLALRRRRR